MDITVDLVPLADRPDPATGATPAADQVTLVIDPLRSATAAALLFDRGVTRLLLTDGLRAARQVATREEAWSIGEWEGMPPEGFNFSSSPAALRRTVVAGRPAVLVATESPRALYAAERRGATALVGLSNALAAAEAVLARSPAHVHVVCAGRDGEPDLADAVAAGLVVSLIARTSARSEGGVTLRGAARFCLSLLRTGSDPLDALWVSAAGAALRRAGFEEDVAMASAVGTTDTVPWVTATEEVAGRPVVELARTLPRRA
jgi:2-phosphosulfolactate phosphatase